MNLAFAHETGLGGYQQVPSSVQDWCRLTGAELVREIEAVARRRKNPLYWIDQFFRVLLGIPAYIVSRLLRVPFERLDSAAIAGPFHRVLGAASSLFAIYLGGRELGWW